MAEPAIEERFPTRWVAAATALGALFLGYLWLRNGTFMDSDEAVVGLMARHIAFKGELPVFYWGQEYMGAVEAYLAVPFFWIFGSSPQAVKLVPVLFTLGTIPIAAQVAFFAAGRRLSITTAFAFATPPLAFALWSLKTRGGFTEQPELGLWFLWATLCIAEAKSVRARNGWAVGAGLMLGVGLWWGEFVVPFALGGVLVLALHPRARAWQVWAIGVPAGIVGVMPALWHNAFTSHWATVLHALRPDPSQARSGQPMHAVPELAWRNLKEIGLPSMLGFHDARLAPYRWSWPDSICPALLCAVAIAGYLIALLYLVRLAQGATARLATLGGLLGGTLMALLFVFSRFGFEREPRYVMAIWLTVAICDGWAAWAASRLHVAGGAAVLALVLGFQVHRTYFVEPMDKLFVWNPNAPAQWSYKELGKRLVADGHTHLYADYWTGERLMFESEEKVLAVDPNGSERYWDALPIVKSDPRACQLAPANNRTLFDWRRRGMKVDVYADVPGLAEPLAVGCPP